MNRRNALKNIGLTLGYATVTPTALSILQSCTTKSVKWVPQFFTPNQGLLVQNLVDLILPKTADSPGAVEVNVPQFIDLLALKTFKIEKQMRYKQQLQVVLKELIEQEKSSLEIVDVNIEKYDALLAKYLKSEQADRKRFTKDERIVFDVLNDLRSKAVWAFKNSKYIGENVLAYNPIPGAYKNCSDIKKTTNGKAWSLQS